MVVIINLTQHLASPDQIREGVIDLPEAEERKALVELLTFETLPSPKEIEARAAGIAAMAYKIAPRNICSCGICWWCENRAGEIPIAMIGGAPYLMAQLEKSLRQWGFQILYSFSSRVSTEETLPDGSVKKIQSFKHIGFIEV